MPSSNESDTIVCPAPARPGAARHQATSPSKKPRRARREPRPRRSSPARAADISLPRGFPKTTPYRFPCYRLCERWRSIRRKSATPFGQTAFFRSLLGWRSDRKYLAIPDKWLRLEVEDGVLHHPGERIGSLPRLRRRRRRCHGQLSSSYPSLRHAQHRATVALRGARLRVREIFPSGSDPGAAHVHPVGRRRRHVPVGQTPRGGSPGRALPHVGSRSFPRPDRRPASVALTTAVATTRRLIR